MLEKIIGVSPSQKGTTQDSKKPESADKKDFENVLQANLQTKTRKNENKKHDDGEKEDLRSQNKEKSSNKTSRGSKKRIVEEDDDDSLSDSDRSSDVNSKLMVSNIMASPESEFEIPDQEDNLATINLTTSETKATQADLKQLDLNKLSTQSQVANDKLLQKLNQLVEKQNQIVRLQDLAEDLAEDVAQNQNQTEFSDQELIQHLLAQQLTNPTEQKTLPEKMMKALPFGQITGQELQISEETPLEDTQLEDLSDFQKMISETNYGIQSDIKAKSNDDQTLKFDHIEVAQRQAEVLQQRNQQLSTEQKPTESDEKFKDVLDQTGILHQMKSFEEAKGLQGEKAKAFEQKVLSQLKQEFQELTAKVATTDDKQKLSENFANLNHEKNEGFDKSLSEVKPESIKADSLLHVGQTHSDFRSQIIQKSGPLSEATTLSQLEAHHDKNIQEVMKQAQYLVKQGGGEMTVKMSPDGMADVQLKVMLDGGKVNIEMQTSDRTVKKIMEDSLSELKSGLAAHHLSVEHVKIDTVHATNTEQQANLHTNLGQSGAQSESREFWKQFQENFGNGSRKSSYNDLVQNGNNRVTNPTPLKGVSNAYRSNGRTGSTLNQVA